MYSIDNVMGMLDKSGSPEEQAEGIRLAQNVKCINVFVQPGSPYGVDVWENCAKVLSARTDTELEPYLIDLLEWLQDMNCPGALLIFDRLKHMKNSRDYRASFEICFRNSRLFDNYVWTKNLEMLEKAN